ncbi:MAG: dihydrolipoyl dehydrogenase [Pseudomonadota bacterium]|nr:dihydrolipoyl dehydrogenase [Pseudomonadota bacterium]
MVIQDVDIAIIGAGTAGMAAYHEVRKQTDRVALIEGGLFGTTCARVGCMPSKLLVAPAHARHRLTVLPAFGISSDAGAVDGSAVMKRVREERDRFVGFVTETVASFDQRHVVRAHAVFEDPHILRLRPASDGTIPAFNRIRAKRIIIATGSRPRIPDSLRAAGDRLVVNDDVFDWQDLPSSVAVFGAGAIGVELGQALHRLGVRVHLFGIGGGIAGISDPEVRDVAIRILGTEMPCSLDARDARIERDWNAVVVHFTDSGGSARSERFDYLLAATGRIANVDTLGLEHAGLVLDARGMPRFDPQTLQCGDSHIFIAGDANADRPVLHEAADEGHMAGKNASSFPEVYRHTRRTPLGIVFCEPQAAFAGKTHAQLTSENVDFAIGQVSFENQGRARVMLVNEGLLRVYGEQRTGLLLGAEMIGPENEHLAHLLAWVIQMRMTVEQALDMPFYHPVIEEGLRTALRQLLKALGMGPSPPKGCIDCGPGA